MIENDENDRIQQKTIENDKNNGNHNHIKKIAQENLATHFS